MYNEFIASWNVTNNRVMIGQLSECIDPCINFAVDFVFRTVLSLDFGWNTTTTLSASNELRGFENAFFVRDTSLLITAC